MKHRITGCSNNDKENNQPLNFFAGDDVSKKLYTCVEIKDRTDNFFKSFFYVMDPVLEVCRKKGGLYFLT